MVNIIILKIIIFENVCMHVFYVQWTGGATPSVCEMLLCCLAHVCSSVCLCSRRNGYMTLNSTEPNETSHQVVFLFCVVIVISHWYSISE